MLAAIAGLRFGGGRPLRHVEKQAKRSRARELSKLFHHTAAQTIQFIPASGDMIYLNGSGVADKYAQIASVIGNRIEVYSDGVDYVVTDYAGVATKQA